MLGEIHVFISDMVVVLGSRSWNDILRSSIDITGLLWSASQLTKPLRESFLDVDDSCLVHPTPTRTPSRASLKFAGGSYLWGAAAVHKRGANVVAIHKWGANVQLGGVFRFGFIYLIFRLGVTTAALQSRGAALRWESDKANLEGAIICCRWDS